MAHELIAQGIHPLKHKKKLEQEKASRAQNSFEAVARAWMDANRGSWSAYYLKQIETLFERYIFSTKQLSSKPISEVDASDIRTACLSVANRDKLKEGERKSGSVVMARNLLQWCGAVFRYAIAHGKAAIAPTYGLSPDISYPPDIQRTPREFVWLRGKWPNIFRVWSDFPNFGRTSPYPRQHHRGRDALIGHYPDMMRFAARRKVS